MMGRLFSRRATLAAAVESSFLLFLGAAAHAAEVKVMSTVALTPTLALENDLAGRSCADPDSAA